MFKNTFNTLYRRLIFIMCLVILNGAFNFGYAQGLTILNKTNPIPRSCDCSPFYDNSNFVNPKLISGNSLSEGAVYRFRNVFPNNPYGTTIDALVRIVQFNGGASLLEMDVTDSGIPEAFQPRINSTNSKNQSVLFNITFVEGGGNYGDEVVISYFASPYDIDGDGGSNGGGDDDDDKNSSSNGTREYAEISLPDAYFISNNTLLNLTQTSTVVRGEAINTSTAPGGDISTDPRYTFSNYFENKSSFNYLIGKKDGNSDRYYSLDMNSADYKNPNSILVTYPVICGQVKDNNNNPLEGVSVNITGSDGSVQNLTTDASGNYKAIAAIPEALVDVVYEIQENDSEGYISISDVDGANDNLITRTINLKSTCGNDFVDGRKPKIKVDDKTHILCNGEATGEIKVSAYNGVPPYQFSLNGNTPQSSPVFNGLLAGIYTIEVIDSLGNTATISVTLSEPEPLSVVITKENATTSQGCNNGEATVSVGGGTSPYTYLWSASAGNQTTATATNLPSGTHTVTITDSNDCTLVQGVVIGCSNTCDAIVDIDDVQDVLCAGEATGATTVSASSLANPSATFTFTWNTNPTQVDSGVTSSTVSNLIAGVYTVSVTIDGTVCQPVEQSVTIVEPSSVLSVSASATDESGPATGDGTVTASVTGGTQPYTYLWSPGGETTEAITNLSAGNYTVTVTDANGCNAEASSTVNPGSCKNLSVTTTATPTTCFGDSNGTATANVTGGSGTFTYLWSPGGATTQSITGLSAGAYVVTITDTVTQCTVEATAHVNEPNKLTVGIAVSNNLCFGDETGSLDLTVTGGTFPYTFQWSNGETTEDINNLSAGTYTVNIIDANGCTTSRTATVSQPDIDLTASITSQTNIVCYNPLGSVSITATGGTQPYTYGLNGVFQSTGEFNDLMAGDYTINVIDANGCEVSVPVTILENCTNAENDINNTFVDLAVDGNVLTNDTDAEGDTQTVTT
ncbi:SprB repeat-containing protein, partial [Flaviramulus multivorans]